jgi:hypothetical protein
MLAALEDPDRGVGSASRPFQAAQKMVRGEAWKIEEAAAFSVMQGALEIGVLHAGLEFVLMDADHLGH